MSRDQSSASRDLMFKDDVQEMVRDAYGRLDDPGAPAAGYYTAEQLAVLPDRAREWALGVGNPLAHADLQPGEVVVDLGSGAGIDTLLAGTAVGSEGRAIGVDMLASMVERARASAGEAGLDNVRFVEAEFEDLPMPAGSVDVVVANGTINLTARKSRVLAEAFRVLRPGGRLIAADPVVDEDELPAEILTHPSAWAG